MKTSKSTEIAGFEAAYQELKEIARALDENKLPIDQLAVMVERAAALSEYCKKNLREIESKLDEAFDHETDTTGQS